MNRIIGLIVNPVAGMGGSVGLKGTDGEMYKRAIELGAEPVAPKRTDEILSHVKKKDCMTLVVAPGKMGERYISACGMPFKKIGTVGEGTSKDDTKRISKEMVNKGAEANPRWRANRRLPVISLRRWIKGFYICSAPGRH